jgi:exodeoxyribonuclease-5
MTTITPSNTQYRAIAAIKEWFRHGTKNQQVFRLFGYAGTGKSTVLKFALEELELEQHQAGENGENCIPGVVTATFTGKAALVLRRKGTPARTIHSLIYSVIEATEEEVEEAEKKIEEAIAGVKLLSGFERTMAETTIQSIRHGVAEMKHPRFALNPKSDIALLSLLFLMGASRGNSLSEPAKTGATGFH